MFNKPYLITHLTKQGRKVIAVAAMRRAVLVNGKVCSVTSGVGRVAHRKICALAKQIAAREREIDRRERGVDVMTVEFRVFEGDKVLFGNGNTIENSTISDDDEGEEWKRGKQA